MIRVNYFNTRQETPEGVELELVGRDQNGKVRRPRVWLSDERLRSLLWTIRQVRRKQRRVAADMTSRADATTQAGLCE